MHLVNSFREAGNKGLHRIMQWRVKQYGFGPRQSILFSITPRVILQNRFQSIYCVYIWYVCVGGPVIWLSLIFLVTWNHPESNASNLPLAVSQHFDHFTRQSPPLKDLETETTASSGSSPRGLEVWLHPLVICNVVGATVNVASWSRITPNSAALALKI